MEKNCFTHRHESTANHQGEVDRLIYIIYIYNIYIKNNKQINTPIPNIDQINIYIYILKYIYIYIYIIYTQIINLLGQHTHTQFCLAAAQQQFQKAKPRKPVALLQWKQHLYLYHGSTTYFNLLGNCGPQLFPTDFLLISMNYVAHPTVPLRTLANICLYILWNFGGLGLQLIPSFWKLDPLQFPIRTR